MFDPEPPGFPGPISPGRKQRLPQGFPCQNGGVKTLVLIPAWNEEASIGAVISDVRDHFPRADVLVVDDGSSDRTAAVARRAGALVASLPFNQGVGAAHQTAFFFARRRDYELLIQLDGDGQHPADQLVRVAEPVRSGEADLAIGSRFAKGGQYPSGFARRVGQRLFGALVSLSTRQTFTDTTSGMRAMNRRAVALFAGRYSTEFAEVESIQQAARAGLTVTEVPVRMVPRPHGRSFITVTESAFYLFKTLVVLLLGHLRPGGAAS